MKSNYLVVSFVLALPLFVASQSYASVIPVDLGTAANFAILAESGISTTGTTAIIGDIGVSPIASTSITGFGLIMDASGTFSTSSLVTGKVYGPDYASPTPAYLTTAIGDMETAYTDAAGRAAGVTELGAGNIGGMTLAPNVYKWGTGLIIPADVTLLGAANDVWIFQIAGTLGISPATKVTLSGGAQAKNIFWQVAGQTTFGTTSQFKGIILDQTAIVMNTGVKFDGRAFAQTAVTLDSNAVTAPGLLTGDVNGDGYVNALDIDAIYDDINARASWPLANLNGDGVVNQADVDYLLANILNKSYGDANLDGKVDFADFQVLLDHWQNSGAGWATGDFTGNEVVDFADFQKLLDNWNTAGAVQPSTPEPATLSLLALGAMGMVRRRSRYQGV